MKIHLRGRTFLTPVRFVDANHHGPCEKSQLILCLAEEYSSIGSTDLPGKIKGLTFINQHQSTYSRYGYLPRRLPLHPSHICLLQTTMNHWTIVWVVIYASLTICKILQYIFVSYTSSRQDSKKSDQIQYAPSFAVLLQAAQMCLLGGDLHPNKVPRKDLKEISDKWVQDYNHLQQSNNTRPRKTFYHLNDALDDFFQEFCQETTALYVWFDRATGTSYINQPLGLCSMVSLMGAIVGMPFLLLREIIMFQRGGPLSVICKVCAG